MGYPAAVPVVARMIAAADPAGLLVFTQDRDNTVVITDFLIHLVLTVQQRRGRV
jgi:hypothetical protein